MFELTKKTPDEIKKVGECLNTLFSDESVTKALRDLEFIEKSVEIQHDDKITSLNIVKDLELDLVSQFFKPSKASETPFAFKLCEFYKNADPKDTDLEIRVTEGIGSSNDNSQTVTFYCHQVILAARSTYFKTALQFDKSEDKLRYSTFLAHTQNSFLAKVPCHQGFK